MRLFKNVRREWCGSQVIIWGMLMVVTISLVVGTAGAADKPMTVAEIALYQGPDREKILIEGAKKEGELTFYGMDTWVTKKVAEAFEKKYPFVKVMAWRGGSQRVSTRVQEEYKAKHYVVDVLAVSTPLPELLHRQGWLQEFYTPEIPNYGDESKAKGETGVYYMGCRDSYNSLAFNTKLIPPAEAPKSLNDLLNPRWKGKMGITGGSPGIYFVGNCLETMGPEFMEKMGRQDVRVYNTTGAGLAGMVVSGEVPLSPCIFYSNVFQAKRKGALVDWRPLEPVISYTNYTVLMSRPPHPHAALLFIDYMQSHEGQMVVVEGGLASPRKDIKLGEAKFKTVIWEAKYSLAEFEKKYNKWESLMKRLFIEKR